MNTAEQVLVVMLAATLGVLLVLLVAIATYVLKIVKSLQSIATKAEHLVESAEEVGNIVRQTAGKLSILGMVQSIVDLVGNKPKK